MKGRITLAAALAVASAGLGTGPMMTPSAPAIPAAHAVEDPTVHRVEGQVVDVRPEGNGAAELKLNDGTRLTLLAPEQPTGERVVPGTRVEAQYRETAGENIVIQLRVMPETQAP